MMCSTCVLHENKLCMKKSVIQIDNFFRKKLHDLLYFKAI